MKFLVCGHYSFDVMHSPAGEEEERPGGLHAAIVRLTALCGKQDRIVPCFGVGASEYQEIVARFREFENVDTSGIFPMDSPTHRVHYFPGKEGAVTECVKELAPPIPFERMKKFLDVEGILLNMVSGGDVRLETLDEIRMAVRGSSTKLHLDFHNLTRGTGEGGVRTRRSLPEWRRWAFMVDTVQMNEEEIAGLARESQDEAQTVGHLLTLSVRGVLVTRAAKGASLFYSEHKKVVRTDYVPAVVLPGNPVTAGDQFGAAFLYHYCRSGSLTTAAEAAVQYPGEGRAE